MPTRAAASAHWCLRCSVGATTVMSVTTPRSSSSVATWSAKVVLPAPGVATVRKSRPPAAELSRYAVRAASCHARNFRAVPQAARSGNAGDRWWAAEVLIGPATIVRFRGRHARTIGAGPRVRACVRACRCPEVWRGSAGAVGDPRVLHPGELARREVVHARVGRVVHEVADGVGTRGGAGVATGRASGGRRGLGGGVVDVDTAAAAAALERVVGPDDLRLLSSLRRDHQGLVNH